MSKNIETIPLKALSKSKKLQCRVALNPEALADYTDHAKSHKEAGTDVEFPPGVVFRDEAGVNHLAAGYTRTAAMKEAGYDEFKFEVREGNARDAWLFGCKDNSTHGSRLTNKDKKYILETALEDKELVQLSSNGLAGMLGLSANYVTRNRPKSKTPGEVVAVRKTGKTSKVKTENIGNKTGPKAPKKAPKKKKDTGAADAKRVEKEQATNKQNIDKIVDAACDDGKEKQKLRTALATGTLNLDTKDIAKLAATSPDRIKKAVPLVTELHKSPAEAFKILDNVLSEKSKFGEAVLAAIGGGGVDHQKLEGSEYSYVVYDRRKFTVEVVPK